MVSLIKSLDLKFVLVLGGSFLSLPTEAQWEYACKAGSTTKYYWGDKVDGDCMWCRENAWDIGKRYAQLVAQKFPNAFGLYDMCGNVWEWCWDTWHDNYDGAPTDDSAWIDDSFMPGYVCRGGSFNNGAAYCGCHTRGGAAPRFGEDTIGFRVVRNE